MSQQRQRSLEEAITFTRNRLSAFRHVLATRDSRVATLLEERAKIDERIAAFERACDEAPAAIARLERTLEELMTRDAQRLAIPGGSARHSLSPTEQAVRTRDRLLRKIAEIEAALPPELRGGGS